MSKSAVKDELRAMQAAIGRGRFALRQMGLSYPGGDACPAMVLRGLAKVRRRLAYDRATDVAYDTEETAALQWLDHWLDAGADMLPRKP